MHKYLVYAPKGTCSIETTQEPISLERLQELVGGYIEQHQLGVWTLMVNEEGNLRQLPINQQFPEYCGVVVQGVVNDAGDFIGAGRGSNKGGS